MNDNNIAWTVMKQIPGVKELRKFTGNNIQCRMHPNAKLIPGFVVSPATKIKVCRMCIMDDSDVKEAGLDYATACSG